MSVFPVSVSVEAAARNWEWEELAGVLMWNAAMLTDILIAKPYVFPTRVQFKDAFID